MDETEEEKKVDLLDVRKSFEKDPRKVIEIEMNKDGIFSERTIYAMENTLNLSLLSPPEGPKLANEAEALFVLSKNGHIFTSGQAFITESKLLISCLVHSITPPFSIVKNIISYLIFLSTVIFLCWNILKLLIKRLYFSK